MTSARARATEFAVMFAVSALIGSAAIHAVFERTGRVAVPLDDAFIHFQYARRFAEFAPFRYTGSEISTGATSLVWPLLLSLFWKFGARGPALIWAAWFLGTAFFAACAYETGRLAARLTSRGLGFATSAMCLSFGPFVWFAWSGMETIAAAWAFVATFRRAAAFVESHHPQPKDAAQLAFFGALAPLIRPEGAIASLFVLAAFAVKRRRTAFRVEWFAVPPVLGVALLPTCYALFTGHFQSSTARAKWLFYNPYFDLNRIALQMRSHIADLLLDVLDGGEWTVGLVPKGFVLLAAFGVLSLILVQRRARASALFTVALFLSVIVTCSYQTFFWNRVRYVWPFMPAALVLIASFAHQTGVHMARFRKPLGMAGPALAFGAAALIASQLPASIDDFARSAAAIDAQHAEMAEWIREALPKDALVGVNDTGAAAYIGERKTFDLVGLTTESETDVWVAGAGSRFEHYERLPVDRLPTHFVVYTDWFGCDVLLGRELKRFGVDEHSILGGDELVAFEANYRALKSGALPLSYSGEIIDDEVDVSDLKSEAAHAFLLGKTWDTHNVVFTAEVDGRTVADGGRRERITDTFEVKTAGGHARLVMRLAADSDMRIVVLQDGEVAQEVDVPRQWSELSMPLLPLKEGKTRIDVRALYAARFASLHYWILR
ncbi:MAG: hypothetical protein IPK82_04950 [Polyangiaceae bacterium]|nr:hypothetical protein [Polyangiaceae bacterium]